MSQAYNEFEDYIIRKIEKKDLKEVHQMLLCLVKHEKIEKRLKLTGEKMARLFFNETPDWFCLVVEDLKDHLLKGFLAYTLANINRAFHHAPLVHIDHLYIAENYRNKGIGERLIQNLKEVAKGKGMGRLELWCMNSNEIGNNFYKKIGAEQLDFVNVYRMNVM